MTEITLRNEELAIKDDRLGRVPPRRRPHYGPTQRMRILKLKAARGWSSSEAARVFAVTEETIASWLKRVDEGGERALVQLSEPVNKFPAYIGYLVRWLKSMCPALGKLRIAQVLGRAGLRLAATTVRQMLQEDPDPTKPAEAALAEEPIVVSTRVLKSKRPDHIWHLDLSVIPTMAGFWVPWQPFSKLLRWPWCWWVAVAIDQFSRRVCGFALFKKMPSSAEVCGFLDRVTQRTGTKPVHIITDKGRQFIGKTFKSWCRRRHVRPRYGAVGKHASVAVIERFIRSMKAESTRCILVPLRLDAMREELSLYVSWYSEHRPHQGLNGMTPDEVYRGEASPSPGVRFEPRPRWPVDTDRDGWCQRIGRLHSQVR
ncbi:MAG: DDE-type integrase/transposase/recombinase [Planctomycetota bacterium]|jgi:transposase InsO family protein